MHVLLQPFVERLEQAFSQVGLLPISCHGALQALRQWNQERPRQRLV